MTRIHRTCFTFVLCCFVASIASATITIDTVPIGNAGNAPDPLTGHGQVNYGYRIGKYEVTAAQYIAFLNAVGGVDTNGLYDTGMSWTGLGSAITRNGAGTAANPYTYSVAPDFANRP